MTASRHPEGNTDILNGPFVAIPYALLRHFSTLQLTHKEFSVLLQIIAAIQIVGSEILSPHDIGQLVGISTREAGEILDSLVKQDFLSIEERADSSGARICHFSLAPLWKRFSEASSAKSERESDKDLVSLFEQEFGRPLSGLECEQIRQWLQDGYPDWLLIESLREAVLANKCSFRYMDRILFDWQRNGVRSRRDLEQYRQSYRERVQGREQAAATSSTRQNGRNRSMSSHPSSANSKGDGRDERYSAFYELFPDA